MWKCKTCGCLWRDNLDDTVSLFDAQQKSCAQCEMNPTAQPTCEIHWLQLTAQGTTLARLREALKRLSQWDVLDSAADGPYWRTEIAAALAEAEAPQEPGAWRVYLAMNRDIEHSDVLGVFTTKQAAERCPGTNGIEVFEVEEDVSLSEAPARPAREET